MTAIQTILGPIQPEALGLTLMHEHLLPRPQIPSPPDKPPFSPRIAIADVIRELTHARDTYGLRSVVDCTPRRSPQELEDMAALSRETGLNIIVATGCMKEQYYHPARGNMSSFWAYQMTPDRVADVIADELTNGINGTPYRAGIIKVGTSKQRISEPEERLFRGAARAHLRTGAPITTHATLGTMGPEQAQIFLEEGADLRRVVIGHSDLNGNPAYHEGILRRGATVGFDTIGKQRFDYTRSDTAGYHRYEFEKEQYFVSDQVRMQTLLELIRRGYAGQIIVSSDMGSEIDQNPDTLAAWGYSFVLGRFLPEARARGLTEADQHRLLVDNPRRILGGV
jgi:predicted metal-dependent phosphotriesterase family hydrolase